MYLRYVSHCIRMLKCYSSAEIDRDDWYTGTGTWHLVCAVLKRIL